MTPLDIASVCREEGANSRMSTGSKIRSPDRPAKDTKKLTAELTMCRSGTGGTIPTPDPDLSHILPAELRLPGARVHEASPPEPLHQVRSLARRPSSWNSIAEHVAAQMQEQLLDMIGLR